ncbi:hypothetical protein M422DRAFT_263467 [Sphaerobolus stellatus SS14]|uniref:Uncharacterized protein n=1 Tax=Sphaerobolus stellatus (strain SS14) TaxID=990650 RepID=A0A0C9TVY5_SPHS4|nr:hypothetical protein M422DRAFT_263467 [Sphaerobolus stellatus SS14]
MAAAAEKQPAFKEAMRKWGVGVNWAKNLNLRKGSSGSASTVGDGKSGIHQKHRGEIMAMGLEASSDGKEKDGKEEHNGDKETGGGGGMGSTVGIGKMESVFSDLLIFRRLYRDK